MSKVAVVYWSGTGNTEAMANAMAEGAKEAGAAVDLLSVDEFNADKLADFDGVLFGCPAMGNEVLEESEFEPMFAELEAKLAGVPVGPLTLLSWFLCPLSLSFVSSSLLLTFVLCLIFRFYSLRG